MANVFCNPISSILEHSSTRKLFFSLKNKESPDPTGSAWWYGCMAACLDHGTTDRGGYEELSLLDKNMRCASSAWKEAFPRIRMDPITKLAYTSCKILTCVPTYYCGCCNDTFCEPQGRGTISLRCPYISLVSKRTPLSCALYLSTIHRTFCSLGIKL